MVVEWAEASELSMEFDALTFSFQHHLWGLFAVVLGQLLCLAVTLLWRFVVRHFLCGEDFIVPICMLNLAEVLTREMFLHLTFKVFAKELVFDDGTNWMNLSCL